MTLTATSHQGLMLMCRFTVGGDLMLSTLLNRQVQEHLTPSGLLVAENTGTTLIFSISGLFLSLQ